MTSALCLSLAAIVPVFLAARDELALTILFDNNPTERDLEAEWGFSCLITGAEKVILFDCGGDGAVLMRNMKKLRVDPQSIDIVVLSHAHGDHTGGLGAVLQRHPRVTVYLLQSFPRRIKDQVTQAGATLREVREPIEICRDVYSTGEQGFAIKEQALAIRTRQGTVVVTGCAHPGIVKIVRRAQTVVPGDVHLALGGFHLCSASRSRISKIVSQLRELGLHKAAPCHCSGQTARELFAQAYGHDYISVGVGSTIRLEPRSERD